MSQRDLPLSVVIATLGGAVLNRTILHINEGECVPLEILVCIPESDASYAECVSAVWNVNVIKTPCRGQVAQRSIGLGMASYPYVMQLDDDIILLPDTLKVLYQTLLALGVGSVLAPIFRLQSTGEEVTRYADGLSGLLRSLHASLVCGSRFGRKRMGTISPAGIGFGLPMSSDTSRIVESEWLPGGAALCHKSDLIAYNYYPFLGKAYSEDLIHSILWRKKGCRLWTCLDASALVDVTVESFAWKSVMSRFLAHVYVAQLSGGRVWRTLLWFIFYLLVNARQILKQNLRLK